MNVDSPALRAKENGAWTRLACLISALAIVFAALAIPYSARFHIEPKASAGIYACFLLLLSLALLPGTQAGRTLLARVRPRWKYALPFLSFCVPYLLYALGTGDFRPTALLRVALVASVPALLYVLFPPSELDRFSGADLAVGVFLITVVLGGFLRHVWTVPVNLDFMGRLLLIAAVSTTWSSIRPVPRLHYRLQLTRGVLRAASLNFLYFALIALPAGLLIGFTEWHPRWRGIAPFALDYLEIFLFIALLEEIFFRGFLQSLLNCSLGSEFRAQVLTSSIFGLFHILHAPFPNWRYVALASVAGWFYGEAYRRAGGIFASALTHALVDTVWRTWFTKL